MVLWEIENRTEIGRWEPPELHRPVALTLTDNMTTGLKELRVTTPEREPVATLVDPDLTFESDGLRIDGHVARPRHRTDQLETWVAQPVVDDASSPAPWRVEIVDHQTGNIVDVIEPATVEEVEVTKNVQGAWTSLRDVSFDEYLAAIRSEEWEWMLLVRGPRSKKRWIDEYGIHRLHRFETTLDGTAKHKGRQTEVLIKLTPSEINEPLSC